MNTPENLQQNSNESVMEENKERREQVQKQKVEEVERDAKKKNDFDTKTMGVGAMAKELIRESIITQHDDDDQDDKAQHPDDVLDFSRSVHKIDSSLE